MTKSTKAVIYLRTAGAEVSAKGGALVAQEARCRDYARQQGYEVASVFHDMGSGTIMPRPGLDKVLDFLSQKRAESPIVIVDSMSVLAPDVSAYIMVRNAIQQTGASVKSPSIGLGGETERSLLQELHSAIMRFEGNTDAAQERRYQENPFKRSLSALRKRFS